MFAQHNPVAMMYSGDLSLTHIHILDYPVLHYPGSIFGSLSQFGQ